MRILLLSSSYNSLTQNAHVALVARGHTVDVATATKAETMRQAVDGVRPDLIVCPMLAQMIPRDLWEARTCLIVHPGIVGDRGAHSLDWAILNGESEWGVTVMQAGEQPDAGRIWAARRCSLRDAGLVDDIILRDELDRSSFEGFCDQVERIAEELSQGPRFGRLVAQKQAARERDERMKPLAHYRREELGHMSRNFWGEDRGYHVARAAFVRKQARDSGRMIAPDTADDRQGVAS